MALPTKSLTKYKVLVVDDDEDIRFLLVQLLELSHYQVFEAANGMEALLIFEQTNPDLVMLDQMMPGMDGLEVCKRLRLLPSYNSNPILFITALNSKDKVEEAFKVGATDYINKPIQPIILRYRVQRIIEGYHSELALRQSELNYRMAVESVKDVIFQLDEKYYLSFVNSAWQDITGFSIDESLNRPLQDFLHPDDAKPDLFDPDLEKRYKQLRLITKQGQVSWVELRLHSANLNNQLFGTMHDINEQYLIEQERLNRLEELISLNEISHLLQSCRNYDEVFKVVYQKAPQLFPNTVGLLYIFNSNHDLLELESEWGLENVNYNKNSSMRLDDCLIIKQQIFAQIDPETIIYEPMHVESDIETVASLCIPMVVRGDIVGLIQLNLKSGDTVEAFPESKRNLVTAMADQIAMTITNLKLQQTLQNQAIRDGLTGLYNRRFLDELLQNQMRRAFRTQNSVGLIMADIDHFKDFNDAYGHLAGDYALKRVSQCLQTLVRTEDYVCRYGGEEFMLVLPEISLEQATDRAEEMRLNVQALELEFEDRPLAKLTISLGVTIFPYEEYSLETSLQIVDNGLYHAKAQGRNRVVASTKITPLDYLPKGIL